MSKSTKIAPKSKPSKASKATKSPAKPLKSKSPAPKSPAKTPAKSAPKSTRPTTLTPSLHVRLAALPPTTRALKMGELASQVHELIRKAGEKNHGTDWYPWLMDLYFDGAQLFVITAENGKLYQYNIAVDENDRASIGERVAVMTKFAKVADATAEDDAEEEDEEEAEGGDPDGISDNYVMASTDKRTGRSVTVRPVTRIFREASGRVRWVSISCTNVLNRVGEIDSAALFDSFIAHANATGEYPIRKLLHLQPDTTWRNGQADFLARDGHLYITSGLFDENSFLADLEIAVREADPSYLGESIGYLPTSAPTMLEVNRNVRVPVYLTGINREISGLAETDAAALFTTTAQLTVNRGGSTPMHKTIKDKLMKLAAKAGKEEEMEAFVATADDTNRAITRDGLVTRAGDGANAGDGDEDGEEVEADDTDADAPIADATERINAGDGDGDGDDDASLTTRAEDASASEIADATEDEADADEMEVEFTDEEVGVLIDSLIADDRFLSKLETLVAELRDAHSQNAADLAALAESVRALTDITTDHADALETVVTTIERIEAVSTRDDTERVRELRRDIPARQLRTGATYRPREQAPVVSARHEDSFSLEDIAAQTLREVQAA